MDISIKPYIGSKIYYYGEIGIKGVLPNEILADKIAVLSTPLVFRRAKDLIDVYALAHCIEVRTQEIYSVLTKKAAVIGEFAELHTRQKDLEHAYDKLKGIEGKPSFGDVYPYLMKLIKPFAQNEKKALAWKTETQTWLTIFNTE